MIECPFLHEETDTSCPAFKGRRRSLSVPLLHRGYGSCDYDCEEEVNLLGVPSVHRTEVFGPGIRMLASAIDARENVRHCMLTHPALRMGNIGTLVTTEVAKPHQMKD